MDHKSIDASKVLFRLGASGTLSPILLLAALVLLLWYINYKNWKNFPKMPGPSPLPLVGNLVEIYGYGVDVVLYAGTIMEKFKGFATIWIARKPLLLIAKPEHLQIFYTDPTMMDRADQYDTIADFLGKESILAANGERWKKVRKMMMMTFHATPSDAFLKNFLIARKDLIRVFHDRADGSTFSSNLPMQVTLGQAIFLSSTDEKMEEDYGIELLSAAHYVMRLCYVRQFTLHLRYDWLFYLLPTGRKYQKSLDFVRKSLSDLVDKKQKEMLKMIENGQPIPNFYIYNMLQKFGDEPMDAIKSEFLNLIGTGMETTAGAICYTLIICGLNPEIQERIYQEDQDVMKALAGNELQVADLEKYEFLDRVIKETLRLFPVAPIIARKLGKDTYFDKNLVPKGTDVAAVIWHAHRNPDVFPDPLKFDPDRFLPENVEKRHPYAYTPFSAGSRGCIGTRYALIGMKAILSGIIREFVIKSHYNSLEEVLSNVQAEITIKDRQDFPIKLLPRKPKVV